MWLTFESAKALESKTSKLFNLIYPNNTILSCFLLFLLINDSYFLIPAVIAEIFNAIAEHIISIGIPRKETKTEIEIPPTAEAKMRKCSI